MTLRVTSTVGYFVLTIVRVVAHSMAVELTNVRTVLHSRPDCVVTRVKISSLTENINRLTVAHHEE